VALLILMLRFLRIFALAVSFAFVDEARQKTNPTAPAKELVRNAASVVTSQIIVLIQISLRA